MKRLDQLGMKLLDGTICDLESRELATLVRDPVNQACLVQWLVLEAHLLESGRTVAANSSVANRVVKRIEHDRRNRVEAGVMSAVNEAPAYAVTDGMQTQPNKAKQRFRFAVLAAVCACILIGAWAALLGVPSNDALAELKFHGANIRVLGADGKLIFDGCGAIVDLPSLTPKQVSASSLVALRENETVDTSAATDTAEVVYSDGTKIELLGETRVRFQRTADGAKLLTVLKGLIQADVAPQPAGKPMRITTNAATLEVLGTTLGVEVRKSSTQLGVGTGRVSMTRKADGQRVYVEAGRFATATESTSERLQSRPFPDLQNEWSEDFENGLPAGWASGEIVAVDGAVAVRAAPTKHPTTERYVIASQNAWQEGDHGLCRIDANSVLHLRIRQTLFARITVMVGARSYPPAAGRAGCNLFYTLKAWNEDLPANKWRTISIPLKHIGWQMNRGRRLRGSPNLDGLAAYLVHISTMEQDAGLVVERMWITQSRAQVEDEE